MIVGWKLHDPSVKGYVAYVYVYIYIYHDTFGDSKPCLFVGMYVYIRKYVIYVCLSVRVVSYSGKLINHPGVQVCMPDSREHLG